MSRDPIVRFEHEKLILNQKNKEERELFERLQKYSGHEGSPYFTLIHNGVKFNQHVGVIQVGRTTIEVLPKTDKSTEDEDIWKNVLIQILRITSGIEASATSKSNLKLQSNSIFDLYIELFIKECEKLTHQGLAKKYRKVQENQTALKGRLHLPGQIRDNLIHKERFHVEYSKYDQNHLINQILKKTLSVLTRIPIRLDLRSRVRRQLLYFDDIGDCAVYEQLFNNIHLNRKTDRYSKALEIARLILLNYHPDISRGANHVLALMFDMNQLWERFITKMIRKDLSDIYQVKAQNKMAFWQSGNISRGLKPDILLIPKDGSDKKIVIDTKWKTPKNRTPSDQDLRQIFAYNKLFRSQKGILLYPGDKSPLAGNYTIDGCDECSSEFDGYDECSSEFVNMIDSSGNLKNSFDFAPMLERNA